MNRVFIMAAERGESEDGSEHSSRSAADTPGKSTVVDSGRKPKPMFNLTCFGCSAEAVKNIHRVPVCLAANCAPGVRSHFKMYAKLPVTKKYFEDLLRDDPEMFAVTLKPFCEPGRDANTRAAFTLKLNTVPSFHARFVFSSWWFKVETSHQGNPLLGHLSVSFSS